MGMKSVTPRHPSSPGALSACNRPFGSAGVACVWRCPDAMGVSHQLLLHLHNKACQHKERESDDYHSLNVTLPASLSAAEKSL